jgi:hypothetical protein
LNATHGRLFFSHRRCTLLLLVYVFSFRHHSLSLRRRPLLSQKQHSLSLFRRSLARSVFSDVPAGLSRSPPLAIRALRITLNFSSQKAGAAAGEGPIRRPERGGEWELIKILLQRENSAYALNSQPRILTQVCQGHIVTTDLATLGANSKQSQNESETQGAKD